MNENQLKRMFPRISDDVLKLSSIPVMEIKETTDVQKLNKTEKAYWEYLKLLGDVWFGAQCITLKLADDTRYTCDFFALDKLGNLRAIEVKGFWRDDAKVKIKVAARMFPFIQFFVAKKKEYGWNHLEVKP